MVRTIGSKGSALLCNLHCSHFYSTEVAVTDSQLIAPAAVTVLKRMLKVKCLKIPSPLHNFGRENTWSCWNGSGACSEIGIGQPSQMALFDAASWHERDIKVFGRLWT
jgi:hypothetical protein